MNILEKIIKKEFDIEPFEVVHLYWNDDFVLGRLSGDFFFNKKYNLICIGMAGLVNSDSYEFVAKTHRLAYGMKATYIFYLSFT